MDKPIVVTTFQDLGTCHSVNRSAVYTARHRNNIITNYALLPNAPGSEEAVSIVNELQLPVSLNFNFTGFRPLSSNVPSLVDDSGHFYKPDLHEWNFGFMDSFTSEDIERELRAQYDWFITQFGRKPLALLTRKNEYGDPKFLMPITDLAKKEGLPVRSPVWQWKSNYGAQSHVEAQGVKATQEVLPMLRDWKAGDVFGFDFKDDFEKYYDILLTSKPTEMIFFPGFVDQELFELSTLNWERGIFFNYIDNDALIDKFRNSVDLVRYDEI